MDFSKEAFGKNSGEYGLYEEIDKDLLPNLFLIYSNAPSESGKVHSKIGFRFKKGEYLVVNGMERLAKITKQALNHLKKKQIDKLPELFNQNFKLRRKMYGDEVIGKHNLEMIKLPRQIGLCSKFSGSGGAIIGIYNNEEEFRQLEKLCQDKNFRIIKLKL
jgi:glucuronokinase